MAGGFLRRLRFECGGVVGFVDLADTPTADATWEALPFTAPAHTSGDEIYFSIPVAAGEENARDVVACVDLAFWPAGQAFCIFFGPTPANRGDEIRAASPINGVGGIEGEATVFRAVRVGTPVRVEAATQR